MLKVEPSARREDKVTVLEVNSACLLVDRTVQ